MAEPRGDPRLAAIVCRENPVLCAEAYGLELAAGVSVWHAFRVSSRFHKELCSRLGWSEEAGVCHDTRLYTLYPLAVAHCALIHLRRAKLTEGAETLVRLYEAAPPPGVALHFASLGYGVAWSTLVSSIAGVDSASAVGGISAGIRVVYIAPGERCIGVRVSIVNEEDAVALALPLGHRDWRGAVSRLAKIASELPLVHLRNTGGQVLEVHPGRVDDLFRAQDGREETTGATVEVVERLWETVTRIASSLLRLA